MRPSSTMDSLRGSALSVVGSSGNSVPCLGCFGGSRFPSVQMFPVSVFRTPSSPFASVDHN